MDKLKKIILVLLLFASCKSNEEKTHPTVESISESVYASGIVKSENQYQVFPTVSGLIKELFVSEGDLLKKGDPIMQVLDETIRLNAENAELAAKYAAVNANKDKLNELKMAIDLAKSKAKNDSLLLVRQRNLWAQQVGSLAELEQRELAYKNSVTNYEAAVLRYNDLKKQLEFAAQQAQNNLQISEGKEKDFTIRSETDGKVYSILKEKGEMVSPQSPVAIVGNANNFRMELQVDEYDIPKIQAGQKILVTLDSYKGQVFEARAVEINPIMDMASRSFTVEASFITRPPVLYPNLTVEANIVIRKKEKALTIPRSYLVDETYVLNEDKEKVKVSIGMKDYQKVEIVSGLTANDVILKPGK